MFIALVLFIIVCIIMTISLGYAIYDTICDSDKKKKEDWDWYKNWR